MPPYPAWIYLPSSSVPPDWVAGVLTAFVEARPRIDTLELDVGLSSNAVLAEVRPGLEQEGFAVENPDEARRIPLPVFFGEHGRPRLTYNLDAFHPQKRIVVEVEAGRAASNNADYKALVQASILPQAEHLVLAVPQRYVPDRNKPVFQIAQNHLGAVFESRQFSASLKGVLLIGY